MSTEKRLDQKNFGQNAFIQINIDTSSDYVVKLKDLVLSKISQDFIPTHLALKIVLGENVSVEILDDTVAFESLSKLPSIEHDIEFDLHENSKLFYICKLKPNFSLGYSKAILQELWDSDSTLTKRLTFNLTSADAYAKVRIRSLATSSQIFKFKTLQNHLHGDTYSCLCIKNVLFNDAKVECDNKIKVHGNACKSFASQVNRNLIVGQNAHVISQPQLEIENDDVKCKHGAITKVIDEEQLFYLENRGIDSAAAKQLLIKGFLS